MSPTTETLGHTNGYSATPSPRVLGLGPGGKTPDSQDPGGTRDPTNYSSGLPKDELHVFHIGGDLRDTRDRVGVRKERVRSFV